MKTYLTLFAGISCIFMFSQCMEQPQASEANTVSDKSQYGGFKNQIEWGEHLVTIGACNDCHTPKKMTPQGPVLDSTLLLSGHAAGGQYPDVDRAEMEKKGYAVTADLTSWVGPWGVSFTANLTSDETGIGNWQEEHFFTAIREGKYKGMRAGRDLLPPMPWDMYKHMTDEELRAVFAFLKSTTPVKNVVPAPIPPTSAMAAN